VKNPKSELRDPKGAAARRRGGFTLIEMMVVIVIIGIVAGLVIKQLSSRAEKAKVEATKAMIAQVGEALDMFKLELNKYPEQLEDLVNMPPDIDPKKWQPGGFLKKYPKDAWDQKFIYRKPGTRGQPYDIISLGADQKEGGEGYDEDLWNSDANKR
jgi:general secretion pathway protein G